MLLKLENCWGSFSGVHSCAVNIWILLEIQSQVPPVESVDKAFTKSAPGKGF